MPAFKSIRARAAKRKGGEAALASLLPKVMAPKALARLGDDRMLAEMAKRVFSRGLRVERHRQEVAGLRASLPRLRAEAALFQPDEFWEGLAGDARIVRNPQKIEAVRENARFVADIAREHGSFGKFLSQWPAGDQIGLLELFAKRGSRLGGRTGQYFLRFIGKDCFVTSPDVVACLRDAGLDIAESPTSKKDLRKIQDQFNAWARRPVCRSPTSRASAPCRSARTTTPRRSRAAATWRNSASARLGRGEARPGIDRWAAGANNARSPDGPVACSFSKGRRQW